MSNGQLERIHSTLFTILRTSLEKEADWPSKLSSVQLAYNSTVCPDSTHLHHTTFYVVEI